MPWRQRRFAAVVDGVGARRRVGLPAVGARLTAAAGFFLAAKRAADLGAAELPMLTLAMPHGHCRRAGEKLVPSRSRW